MPHPLAPPLALIFTTYGIALALYTFLRPLPAARLFGLDPDPKNALPASYSANPALQWVPIMGGRNLAIGVAMGVFWWKGMREALGILLMCLVISGAVDAVVTGAVGLRGAGWTHAGAGLVLGLVGWGMLVE